MIIVFGSMNIDLVMPVHHFPKPGETVLCSSDYLSRPGGKGSNQAMAASKCGAKVTMVGKVGDDSFGRRCVANLKNQSIWTSGIGISDRPTGCANIAVDMSGENIVMVAPGANLDATADQLPDEAFTSKNIVLTQLEVSPEEAFSVLARAHRKGATTILNASPAHTIPGSTLANVDYLIVNEIEAHQLAQGLELKMQDAGGLAREISARYDLVCIITLQEKGAVAAGQGGLYAIGALPVEVVDTTGAGDAFCGIFAACLQAEKPWTKALHYASTGASLSCLGLGAQSGMPALEDIESNLGGLPAPQKIS